MNTPLNGEILRKLTWVSDGSQSSWACVEGEKEDWEDAVVFSQNNFDRCSEMLKYDKHLNYLPADEYAEKIRHLKAVWDKREYILESQLPLGDGTIPGAIIQHLGLPRR